MSTPPLPEQQEAQRGETLATWGIKFTKIYVICLLTIIPIAAFFEMVELSPMSLNELGDFLAGVFGPLSIFWLVLGFFQQGSELRLQVAELSRSVDQQKELVSVTRETLVHEKGQQAMRERFRLLELQPRFIISGRSGISLGGEDGWIKDDIEITNTGGSATNVKLDFDPEPVEGRISEFHFMGKGHTGKQQLKFLSRGKLQFGSLSISYTDDEGTKHRVQFAFVRNSGELVFTETGRSEGSGV